MIGWIYYEKNNKMYNFGYIYDKRSWEHIPRSKRISVEWSLLFYYFHLASDFKCSFYIQPKNYTSLGNLYKFQFISGTWEFAASKYFVSIAYDLIRKSDGFMSC